MTRIERDSHMWGQDELEVAVICSRCEDATTVRGADGRYGKFLHVRCFNSWWRSVYGDVLGPYYRWMRRGMCVR